MDEPIEGERDTIIVEEPGFQHGFTMVPNLILKTKALTHGAKLCYAMLLSYAWQEARCFPGQERLADDLGVERKAVIRYLKELKDGGAIRVQRRGMGKTNVYVIVRLGDVPFLGLLDVPKTGHQDVPSVRHHDVPPVGHKEDSAKKTQGKKSFEASKAPPVFPHVDNPEPDTAPGDGAPDRYRRKRADLPAHAMIPITRLIEDLSRDLDDQDHLQSNISRAANLYEQYADDVDSFFVRAYEARTFARHQVNARSRMALFFAALERELKA